MHDLHIHLGGAVPSSVLWEILCDNGLKTEYIDFATFHSSLTARHDEVKSLDDFLGRYFEVTEEIQSSPSAASVSAYQVVAKAYRRAQIAAIELRFNPHKRVRHGLHTMDAIILAVIQGLERASLHYGVATGIILSLGRDLSLESNW
ncbi:adenosine deaminase, partial [bacterium]|nr:adenosine deaminase [bacterium]